MLTRQRPGHKLGCPSLRAPSAMVRGLTEVGPRQSSNCLTRPDLHYGAGADRGTDFLLVGFVLVRCLVLAAKCLVLAAMQLRPGTSVRRRRRSRKSGHCKIVRLKPGQLSRLSRHGKVPAAPGQPALDLMP